MRLMLEWTAIEPQAGGNLLPGGEFPWKLREQDEQFHRLALEPDPAAIVEQLVSDQVQLKAMRSSWSPHDRKAQL
jgi:hypothetical protein